MRVRLTVTGGAKVASAPFRVGGQGKPVRNRRGPATVTGGRHPHERASARATGPPTAVREGAGNGRPGSQETCPDRKAHIALVERGGFMLHRLAGLALAVIAVLVTASLAAAAPVTVRVEGAAAPMLPPTAVNTVPGTFTVAGGGSCSSTSMGGALQLATSGRWGGQVDPGLGQTVETVLGVTHPIGAAFDGRFWSLYLNDSSLGTNVCAAELQAGDEVLVYEGCGALGATGCFAGEPLDLKAPAVVRTGVPFSASVAEVTTNPNPPFDSSKAPSAGATVSGGGVSATTNAAGAASLTLNAHGPVTLTASKGDRVRESVTVCVTNGADGACGSAAVGAPQGVAGVAVDRTAPRARLLSPRSGHVYRFRTFSPRLIHIAVAESGSGVRTVKLRLTRKVGKRCFSYSGRRERFIGAKCGTGFFFGVSDRQDFTYLLPKRLPRGHYVLDVGAVDKAFNRDRVGVRGRNRSVFDVR